MVSRLSPFSWKPPLNKQQVISLSDIFISPLEDMYVGRSNLHFHETEQLF
jgi:hypothetical protein